MEIEEKEEDRRTVYVDKSEDSTRDNVSGKELDTVKSNVRIGNEKASQKETTCDLNNEGKAKEESNVEFKRKGLKDIIEHKIVKDYVIHHFKQSAGYQVRVPGWVRCGE